MVAITFDPHPMAVLRPEHAPTTLTSLEVRAELLADAGADACWPCRSTARWPRGRPEEFVERVLVDGLHAAVVVVGANFRFGNKAARTSRSSGARGASRFSAEGIPLDGGPQVWSSTYVR